MGRGNFILGQGASHCKVYGHSAVIYQEMLTTTTAATTAAAAPTAAATGNRVLDWVQIPHGEGQFYFGGIGVPL